MSATILDPACGGRMFWFDKHDPRVLFGDCRDESWELCDGRRFDVKPDPARGARPTAHQTRRAHLVHGAQVRASGRAWLAR